LSNKSTPGERDVYTSLALQEDEGTPSFQKLGISAVKISKEERLRQDDTYFRRRKGKRGTGYEAKGRKWLSQIL
jgi:hypothetical protein